MPPYFVQQVREIGTGLVRRIATGRFGGIGTVALVETGTGVVRGDRDGTRSRDWDRD